MNISPADLAVFVGFFAVVISLSVWKSRRAKGHVEDSSDFFLAGRGLTWPLIGISIVAANISTEQMVGMAGQAAGATGLAVAGWQLLGSLFIVIIAMTLLPRFLRAGIYTMPEFLEYRYNSTARAIMALLTVVIYAVVMLPAVLYSGGVTLKAIAGIDLRVAVWLIGLVGTVYCTIGGLKAIAWADLVQGLALLAGGLLVFFLGLRAVGGWESFASYNADKLHMVLPADNPDLPWTGVVGGMWIVMLYYCGLEPVHRAAEPGGEVPETRPARDGLCGRIVAAGSVCDRDAGADGAAAVCRPAGGQVRCGLSDDDHAVDPAGPARVHLRGHRRRGDQHAGFAAEFRFDHRHDGRVSEHGEPECLAGHAGLAGPRPDGSLHARRMFDRPGTRRPAVRRGVPIHPAVPGIHLAGRGGGLPRRLPVAPRRVWPECSRWSSDRLPMACSSSRRNRRPGRGAMNSIS